MKYLKVKCGKFANVLIVLCLTHQSDNTELNSFALAFSKNICTNAKIEL